MLTDLFVTGSMHLIYIIRIMFKVGGIQNLVGSPNASRQLFRWVATSRSRVLGAKAPRGISSPLGYLSRLFLKSLLLTAEVGPWRPGTGRDARLAQRCLASVPEAPWRPAAFPRGQVPVVRKEPCPWTAQIHLHQGERLR